MWTLLISAVIAVYVMIGGLPFIGTMLQTQAQQPINDAGAQLRIFQSVLQHIQNEYVDEPDLEKVRLGALRGLVGGLDPYSSYLTPDQMRTYRENGNAGKVGIGAEFSQVSQYLYVVSVGKGSSAEKAGLRTGDVIEYIENRATRDISLYDAKQLILGEKGSVLNMRVLRPRERPQMLKIERAAYTPPGPESRVEADRVGVLTVHSLVPGTAEKVKAEVERLAGQGVSKMVVDLRGVASGTLDEAVEVANLFVGTGELAKIIGRNEAVNKAFQADPKKVAFKGEIAVLIDFGTAGAGEAVAAAVLHSKRGEVIGERTFGAGVEQQLVPLRGGDGLLLTTARWASPAGTPFLADDRNNMGVRPTVEVKRPDTPEPLAVEELIEQQEEEAVDPQARPDTPERTEPVRPPAEDVQMNKALEILRGKAAAATAG
jgi:carboxyl-terminal processing protease